MHVLAVAFFIFAPIAPHGCPVVVTGRNTVASRHACFPPEFSTARLYNMDQPSPTKILLGISGSIAAYKATLLARELMRGGAEVRVVMTPAATKFLPALTMENLTRHPVAVEMFDHGIQNNGSWHIHLARWCDAMIIAPCSAATLGRLANGICDTALATVALALPPEKSLLLAPAMDTEMWIHPATQRNVGILQSYGAIVIPPASGALASGFSGEGRLPDTPVLVDAILSTPKARPTQQREQQPSVPQQPTAEDAIRAAVERPNTSLQDGVDERAFDAELELIALKKGEPINKWHGKKVVITAGPTYEKIDAVRFIGNYSSGKMGFALADVAAKLGAHVTLVAGPVSLPTPEGVVRIDVESTEQMYKAVNTLTEDANIFILAAAVADYMPIHQHTEKLKKTEVGNSMTIELQQTPDILASLGKQKRDGQVLVGFALETNNVEEYGKQKLEKKNCDMIVMNAANKPNSGFGGDNNTITILTRDGSLRSFPPMSKHDCAREILGAIERCW